jgi:hypothetical protein
MHQGLAQKGGKDFWLVKPLYPEQRPSPVDVPASGHIVELARHEWVLLPSMILHRRAFSVLCHQSEYCTAYDVLLAIKSGSGGVPSGRVRMLTHDF